MILLTRTLRFAVLILLCSSTACLRTAGDLTSERAQASQDQGDSSAGELVTLPAGASGGSERPCEEVEIGECDDRNPCTVDTVTRDLETCEVACMYTPIEACGALDSCCPPSCNAPDDPDCSSCGNGNVDVGETCDGDCPEMCDDDDPCTEDQLVGSASECNVRCLHSEVTECGLVEGCCPAHCDQLNDGDCAPRCGDHVIDEGEICDGDCPTTCADNVACTQDLLTGTPDQCNVMCSYPTVLECISGDGCCPFVCDHTNDSDCPFRCVGDHRCVPQPPEGWIGMGVLNLSDDLVACPDSLVAFEPQLYRGPEYSAANCGCTCGEVDVNCGPIEVSSSPPTTCLGGGHQSFEPNRCTRITNVTGSCGRGRWRRDPNDLSCPASATVSVDPFRWAETVNLCKASFPSDVACLAQEVCVPTQLPEGFAGVCIYRGGVHSCPDTFPVRVRGYTDYEDDRACSSCSCNPENISCSTTLRSYTNNSCTVLASANATTTITSTEFLDHQSITFTGRLNTYLRAETPTISGACTPSGGAPRGEITKLGAHTICCEAE